MRSPTTGSSLNRTPFTTPFTEIYAGGISGIPAKATVTNLINGKLLSYTKPTDFENPGHFVEQTALSRETRPLIRGSYR